MNKLSKKHKDLLVKTKQYKTIHDNTCTFLIQRKLQQLRKRHLKI